MITAFALLGLVAIVGLLAGYGYIPAIMAGVGITRAKWEPAYAVPYRGIVGDALDALVEFVRTRATTVRDGADLSDYDERDSIVRGEPGVLLTGEDYSRYGHWIPAARWALRRNVQVLRFTFDGYDAMLTSEGRLRLGCQDYTLDEWAAFTFNSDPYADNWPIRSLKRQRQRDFLVPMLRSRLAEVQQPATPPAPAVAA